MARIDDRKTNLFLAIWTLSVIATTLSYLFYLSVRVQGIELGYELGKAHAELARLREVERVLELEVSAQETPERIDMVARTLFGMSEPEAERVFPAGFDPQGSKENSNSDYLGARR